MYEQREGRYRGRMDSLPAKYCNCYLASSTAVLAAFYP